MSVVENNNDNNMNNMFTTQDENTANDIHAEYNAQLQYDIIENLIVNHKFARASIALDSCTIPTLWKQDLEILFRKESYKQYKDDIAYDESIGN